MDYLVEHFYDQIDCYYNTTPPDINLHIHNHDELFLFIQGDVRYFIDGKSILLEPGDLVFLNYQQIHGPKLLSTRTYERYSIHFSPQLAYDLSTPETDLMTPFKNQVEMMKLTPQQLTKAIFLFDKITREYHQPSRFGHDVLLRSYLSEVLTEVENFSLTSKIDNRPNHLPELVVHVLDYINEEIADPSLSLEAIAEHFSHNPAYVNRLFKKELGSTIYQYILLSRISIAKRFLEEERTVQEACFLSGFNDYANFIRTFKKITTISPKQYALRQLKNS